MPTPQSRHQELVQKLEDAYSRRTEVDRLLGVTINPTERARLEIDLTHWDTEIKRLEEQVEEEPFTDNDSVIRAYLDTVGKGFGDFGIARPIKLSTKSEEGGVTERLVARRDLQKMEAFLISEETKLLSVRKQQTTPRIIKEVPIEDFLVEHRRILLLGAPGTGKTITLWRLFQLFSRPWLERSEQPQATSDILPPGWDKRVPVMAQLHHWEDQEKGLLDFLQDQIRESSVPEFADLLPDLMKAGQIVLLLDGLEELPGLDGDAKTVEIDDSRAKAITLLDERWKNVACVLTCRSRESAGAPSWPSLSLSEMKREQVLAFAEAYYGGDAQATQLAAGLVRGIYDTSDLRAQKLQGLAARPLYLVKLLDYYQVQKNNGASDKEALPVNPARLLKFTVNETLTREVQDKRLTETEATDLHDHLSALAFCMIAAGITGAVDKNRATAWIFHIQDKWNDGLKSTTIEEKARAARFWELAEGASLITDTGNNLQFYSLALQEYFCACYCTIQNLNAEFLEWTTQPIFKDVWPYWAKLDKNLRDKLVAFLDEKCSGKVCWDASTALVNIGDDKVIALLGDLLEQSSSQLRSRAITALGRMGQAGCVQLLVKGLADENGSVRASAAAALSQFGEPALRPLIGALRDTDPAVRYSAATALGKLGDPRAANALNWVLQDQSDKSQFGVRVRQAALNALESLKQRQAS
jgi:hypothetical protein